MYTFFMYLNQKIQAFDYRVGGYQNNRILVTENKKRGITILLGSSPYNGIIRTAQKESDGHEAQVICYILK